MSDLHSSVFKRILMLLHVLLILFFLCNPKYFGVISVSIFNSIKVNKYKRERKEGSGGKKERQDMVREELWIWRISTVYSS